MGGSKGAEIIYIRISVAPNPNTSTSNKLHAKCPYLLRPIKIEGLKAYFHFYNNDRPHQSLGSATPARPIVLAMSGS